MEIILRESMKKLGKAGEIVKVAPGYARNYLLPKGLVIMADKKNLEQLERQQKYIIAKAARLKEEHEALATQLQSLDIIIAKRAGEESRLYGAVTSMDIAEAIAAKGFEVDKKKIQLSDPIKAIGEYQVTCRLSADVSCEVTVKVVAQA